MKNANKQLDFARNIVQNGINIDCLDMWAGHPLMDYEIMPTLAQKIKVEKTNETKPLKEICESWLRGLPEAVDIPFTNHDIIKAAKNFGLAINNANESSILDNYWQDCGFVLSELIHPYY